MEHVRFNLITADPARLGESIRLNRTCSMAASRAARRPAAAPVKHRQRHNPRCRAAETASTRMIG